MRRQKPAVDSIRYKLHVQSINEKRGKAAYPHFIKPVRRQLRAQLRPKQTIRLFYISSKKNKTLYKPSEKLQIFPGLFRSPCKPPALCARAFFPPLYRTRRLSRCTGRVLQRKTPRSRTASGSFRLFIYSAPDVYAPRLSRGDCSRDRRRPFPVRVSVKNAGLFPPRVCG